MKYRLVFVLCLFLSISFAQEYFQQEVNYKIEVSLDDKQNILRGKEQFEYINNSKDELSYIYIHLWPNAYKNGKTALAQQLKSKGDEILINAPDSTRGFIDSLDFKVDGENTDWNFHPDHIDIAKITLNNPLKPGESCLVSTPFKVKIPSGKISRLGHVGESYQITQWYPKPAVYDVDGWHEMPYLNQGEFYSEYGSFDVSITLPENYVVGATGDLQTQSEIDFLNERAIEGEKEIAELNAVKKVNQRSATPFPASSKSLKTIRFTQDRVHDFAWFADKRYFVLKGEVELPNTGRKVTSWAMFVPQNIELWQDAIEYINDGTYYYSKWNGDYPYNQVTAVDGTISAGGGMEYPNVTVIGNTRDKKSLETVIVHEVGHNWFYGIMGSNERVHGWMDEGLNTLNEMRYFVTKYPDYEALAQTIPFVDFHGLNYHDQNDLFYRTLQSTGLDEPIETHSACFGSANYGVVMYQKTGLVFEYMRHYLGDEKFDKAMKTYFDRFSFKHPKPHDLKKIFEEVTDENVDWLFDELINTTKRVEARLGKVKKNETGVEVTVHNSGKIKGPIPVALLSGGDIVDMKWLKPGQTKSTLQLKGEGDKVMIDPLRKVPELSRQNNMWRADGLIKKWEPFKLKPFIGYNWSDQTNAHWVPLIIGNAHDKLMLGAAVHNYSVAPNRFNYFLAPFYSFGRTNASGFGEISYSFHHPALNIGKFGLSMSSFKDESTFEGNRSFYAAISPYLRFDFSNRSKAFPLKQMLLFQGLAKQTRRGSFYLREFGGFTTWNTAWNKGRINFESVLRGDYVLNEQTQESVGRFMGSAQFSYDLIPGSDWKSNVRLRTFAGYNFHYDVNSQGSSYRYGIPLSGMSGSQDVFVEQFFLNRSAETHRVNNRGGFLVGSDFGIADTWMQTNTLFIGVPTPEFIPGQIGAYGNIGWFEQSNIQYNPYAVGIGYELGEFLGLYYALFESENLSKGYIGDRFGQRLRVTLSIDLFNSQLLPKVIE